MMVYCESIKKSDIELMDKFSSKLLGSTGYEPNATVSYCVVAEKGGKEPQSSDAENESTSKCPALIVFLTSIDLGVISI